MEKNALTLFERFKGLLWMGLWFVLDQGLVTVVIQGLRWESTPQRTLAIAMELGGAVLIIILSYFAIKFYRKSRFAEQDTSYTRKDLIANIGFYVLLLAYLSIVNRIMTSQGINTTANQKILESFMNKDTSIFGLIAYGTVITILAPFFEELIFRGIVVTRILPESPWIAGILSSILFSFVHIPSDIWSFLLYFGMSLIMHASFVRRRNLMDSITVHLFNNGFSYIILVLTIKGIIS